VRLLQTAAEMIGRFWDRLQAEEALRDSRAELAAIIESSPFAMMTVDEEWRIRKINQNGSDLVGPSPKEMIGHRCGEAIGCIHAFENHRGCGFGSACVSCPVKTTVLDTIRTGESHYAVEANMSLCQQEKEVEKTFLLYANPLTTAGEQSALVVLQDITERKRTEKKLRQALETSQRRQSEISALLKGARAVLEHRDFTPAAEIIFEICKDLTGATAGYVALMNDEGTENEVLFLDSGGRPCTVDPDLPMPIRGLRAEAYHSGQAVHHNDFHHSDWMKFMPQGHVQLNNVLFAPLAIAGQTVGLIGLANKPGGFNEEDDRITSAFGEIASIALMNSRMLESLEESEEKLRHYAAELERSNEELEQFAYVASHDLREPARMVKSYLELLENRYRGELDEKADTFIYYAVDGAERMQEMINALLDLSRVGTRGKEPAPTDAEAVLERTLTSLGKAIEENDAMVTHDPLPTVMADQAQLAQVFQNLIANGIKFQRDGVPPQVHISAEQKGDDEWKFCVEDNGIGIDPEQAERLFQIFQRLHTREEYEGTGIGLALCRRIVERHGGRIWVESEVGAGSMFCFTLPGSGTRMAGQ
jgi:signal transduction histidine kinase